MKKIIITLAGKSYTILHTIGTALMIVLLLGGLASCSLGNTSRLKMMGNSMQPNFSDGQILKVEPVDDLSTLQRGDVIFFEWNGDSLLKRLIAFPGETIEIRQDSILINGQVYEEPYEVIEPNYEQESIQLGEDEYYVLGDNRTESRDSHEFGPITGATIKGRVVR